MNISEGRKMNIRVKDVSWLRWLSGGSRKEWGKKQGTGEPCWWSCSALPETVFIEQFIIVRDQPLIWVDPRGVLHAHLLTRELVRTCYSLYFAALLLIPTAVPRWDCHPGQGRGAVPCAHTAWARREQELSSGQVTLGCGQSGEGQEGRVEQAEGVQSAEDCKLEWCAGSICCSFKNLTKKNLKTENYYYFWPQIKIFLGFGHIFFLRSGTKKEKESKKVLCSFSEPAINKN